MEIQSLDYSEFELLVGLLLQREGYKILKTPGPPGTQAGSDYEVIGPDGIFYFVVVKHLRSAVPFALVHRFVHDIERLRSARGEGQGLLIISGTFSSRVLEFLASQAHIKVWDGSIIQDLLRGYPDIAGPAVKAATVRKEFLLQGASLLLPPERSESAALIAGLSAVLPGPTGWKAFEGICVDILSYTFSPALGAPEIQNRSDDDLDIIDAIYPIRSRDLPWSSVRTDYRTRFVVAEFKNYSEPVSQRQVESLAQYLWQPAMRMFGILVSRSTPSASAYAARRRAWLESQKCIVMLEDDDLVDMLHCTESGSDPFEIVDAQLEEFLRGLTP